MSDYKIKANFTRKMFKVLILSSIITTVINQDYTIVATAIFYTDSSDNLFLVTGALPKVFSETVENDVRKRFHINGAIDVVPAFENIGAVPSDEEIAINMLKKKFPSVFVAAMSGTETQDLLFNLRKYMLSAPFLKYMKRQDLLKDTHKVFPDYSTMQDKYPVKMLLRDILTTIKGITSTETLTMTESANTIEAASIAEAITTTTAATTTEAAITTEAATGIEATITTGAATSTEDVAKAKAANQVKITTMVKSRRQNVYVDLPMFPVMPKTKVSKNTSPQIKGVTYTNPYFKKKKFMPELTNDNIELFFKDTSQPQKQTNKLSVTPDIQEPVDKLSVTPLYDSPPKTTSSSQLNETTATSIEKLKLLTNFVTNSLPDKNIQLKPKNIYYGILTHCTDNWHNLCKLSQQQKWAELFVKVPNLMKTPLYSWW